MFGISELVRKQKRKSVNVFWRHASPLIIGNQLNWRSKTNNFRLTDNRYGRPYKNPNLETDPQNTIQQDSANHNSQHVRSRMSLRHDSNNV